METQMTLIAENQKLQTQQLQQLLNTTALIPTLVDNKMGEKVVVIVTITITEKPLSEGEPSNAHVIVAILDQLNLGQLALAGAIQAPVNRGENGQAIDSIDNKLAVIAEAFKKDPKTISVTTMQVLTPEFFLPFKEGEGEPSYINEFNPFFL